MASFNKVILVGNLTRDPELRYTPQGTAVCDLGLAVNQKHKDREETLFIDTTVWDRTAENCVKFLKKGSPVLVEGRLQEDQWEDKETGKTRSKMRVQANTVQFLGGREGIGVSNERSPQTQAPAHAPIVEPHGNDSIPF